ncbi:MAG: hypothetical protein ACFB15_25855 [Cyclobacteriaceae bacterium]
MRNKQRAFYKHPGSIRHSSDKQRLLSESKQLEKQVDEAITHFEGQQKNLGL